jgi:hypothetical protein
MLTWAVVGEPVCEQVNEMVKTKLLRAVPLFETEKVSGWPWEVDPDQGPSLGVS